MKKAFAALLLALLALALAGCAEEQQVLIDAQRMTVTPAPTPEPTPPPYVNDAVFVVESEGTINLRESSSSSSELIRAVSSGEEVNILGYRSQRYAKVRLLSTGEEGYLIAGYLKAKDYSIFDLDTVKVTAQYSYDAMKADMQTLAGKYPDAVTVDSIGTSLKGRDIPVMRIGNEASAKHVLIQAAIHGREHMTSLLTMALAERYLAEGVREGVCFHMIPMSNPDGVTLAQSEVIPEEIMDIYTNDGKSGRSVETGAMYLSQWQANARGVDLNRNFDAAWENVKTCESPSFMDYRGEGIESEPETKALVAYTQKYLFAATVSYHATGSAIYWEYGKNAAANARAEQLALLLEAVTAYEPMPNNSGSCGGYKDWALDKLSIPSVTMEIGTRTTPLEESEFSNVWLRNRDVMGVLADFALAN